MLQCDLVIKVTKSIFSFYSHININMNRKMSMRTISITFVCIINGVEAGLEWSNNRLSTASISGEICHVIADFGSQGRYFLTKC